MKSRTRNIILIGLACVLLVVIVLCSTLFTVKNVKVNFLDVNHTMTEASVLNKIDEADCIARGHSVFLLSKSKTVKAVEKSVPYLRVINIETICPDTVRVNCVERKDCYAIKVGNASYAIVDKYYKVLRVANATALPIIDLGADGVTSGDFVGGEDVVYYEALTRAFDKVAIYENAINTSFASIALNDAGDGKKDFVLKTKEGGITINVRDVAVALDDKVNKLMAIIGRCASGSVVNIYISNNQVIAEENA